MKEKDQLSMGVILHFGINSSDERKDMSINDRCNQHETDEERLLFRS